MSEQGTSGGQEHQISEKVTRPGARYRPSQPMAIAKISETTNNEAKNRSPDPKARARNQKTKPKKPYTALNLE